MAADSAALKKQIEFYFSDSNYRKDTFLKAAAETDPEGFIPVAVLLTFNKMKTMGADVQKIVEAIKDSEIVLLNADHTKLKKAVPLPEDDTSKQRTVYAKGYPIEDSEVTIEAVTEAFSKYGKINLVKLRREIESKKFKGSCFIEFSTEDEAKQAVEECNKGGEVQMKFKDTPLLCVLALTDWLHRKDEKNKKRKEKQNKSSTSSSSLSAAEGSDEQPSKRVKREDGDNDDVSPNDSAAVAAAAYADKIPEFTPGLIMKIEQIQSASTVDELKTLFGQYGSIKYVEYTEGETHAFIRAADVTTVEAVKTAIDDGLTMKPKQQHIKIDPDSSEGETKESSSSSASESLPLACSIVTGEEEIGYYKKMVMKSAAKQASGGGRGGRGGGRGGRGRGGGRGGGRGEGRGGGRGRR